MVQKRKQCGQRKVLEKRVQLSVEVGLAGTCQRKGHGLQSTGQRAAQSGHEDQALFSMTVMGQEARLSRSMSRAKGGLRELASGPRRAHHGADPTRGHRCALPRPRPLAWMGLRLGREVGLIHEF